MFRNLTAFTLIELLVVISIISLLIAILLPSLGKARESAKTVTCLSQQRQLAIGSILLTRPLFIVHSEYSPPRSIVARELAVFGCFA